MRKIANTRRAGYLGEQQHGGLEVETERTGVQSHKQNNNHSPQAMQRAYLAERRRTQQQCRDYWRKVYGRDAERASRGGVSWLGGAHA